MCVKKVSVYQKPEELYTMFVHYVFEVTEAVFSLVLALMQPEGHRHVSIKKN